MAPGFTSVDSFRLSTARSTDVKSHVRCGIRREVAAAVRLEDCVLDADLFVTAPLVRSQPEVEWERARESKAIPESLYLLYCRAHYLSFGAAPLFLKDDENILFGYFSMLLRGLMESLSDAEEQLKLFVEAHSLVYDQGKVVRHERWEASAAFRARRHFRDTLLSLQTSLDTLAELIAVFLTGVIPRFSLGRAQFVYIESWLAQTPPSFDAIITPYDDATRMLYDALRPLVHADGPERDWLRLMRMLRNKIAHLSPATCRTIGLHDKSLRFYEFLPRIWPFMWERHMQVRDSKRGEPNLLPNLFFEILVHQDIESYMRGLRGKSVESDWRGGVHPFTGVCSVLRFSTKRSSACRTSR